MVSSFCHKWGLLSADLCAATLQSQQLAWKKIVGLLPALSCHLSYKTQDYVFYTMLNTIKTWSLTNDKSKLEVPMVYIHVYACNLAIHAYVVSDQLSLTNMSLNPVCNKESLIWGGPSVCLWKFGSCNYKALLAVELWVLPLKLETIQCHYDINNKYRGTKPFNLIVIPYIWL